MLELLAQTAAVEYTQLGATVVISLGAFKVFELLLAKIRSPASGNGTAILKSIENICREVQTCQQLTAQRMKDGAELQREIAGAVREQLTQMAVWVGRGCPNAGPIQDALHRLEKAISRIEQKEK